MKFSKPFTSSSSMPAFSAHTGSATASQSSAPPSALDIVQGQGVHSWDSFLSPMVEASSTLPQDDSELMDSPSFILGGSPDFETTSASSTTLATATGVAEPFSWDISSLSSTHLRPSGPTVGDVHTATASLPHNGTQPTAPTAFTSTYPLLPLDSTTYSNYPYATPYELASVSGRTQVIPEEAPATVSPAAVSLSQVAPPSRVETRPTKISTPTITTPAPVMKQETVLAQTLYSREARGRKDAKIGRPAAISAPRKAEASSIETSTAKKGKNAGKQSSGSENGTPAPTKRRGGTRISVADFVPPDVTGLSKREARLVKNRAAAFLSRQRKREEFELMEVRLAEILEENARLKGEAPGTPSASAPVSDEVQRLQEMLRDAQEREQALKAQLEEQTRLAEQSRLQAAIKAEEPSMTVQEALKLASPMIQSPRSDISSLDGSVFSSALKEKDSSRHSGPGFNLMVLVFSLTMLSMPHQHQLQSMRGAGAQPTRIMYEPSGSATSSAFPSLFENVLERWEGANKIESVDGIEPVDEDDEMEVEVEPWEQDEAPADQTKSGNSYVVDFEMPVLADQVGKDEDGKIKVRISPVGVPRPRKANGGLKQGELAWGGSPLPPLETSTSTFASDWETWGGWKEFLSDDVVATTYPSLVSDVPSISIEEALSPSSEMEQSVVVDDNSSERWATPPPFPTEGEETPSDATLATVLSGEQQPQGPVDVDVSLSTLPAWSRALVQAAAGEKLKARIRVSKKSRMGRSKNTLSLGKKKMGLVVKVDTLTDPTPYAYLMH
ncbi:3973_t:CDS:2 [Acaulospora colombiana]|uniref:3973_t:CDS:1 n=1 Tax=Acaulospora colombiana TaxID=27376 RepID=A0ACA9LYN8_9GLOM|nr:3973_t:CDS:2 [Acaulospora colombiana]